MKKTFFLALAAAFMAVTAYFAYPLLLKSIFSVSGVVNMPEALRDRYSKPNIMLFITAKNKNGIPVAVKRIINPVFPLEFRMNASNLIMPDLLEMSIYLEAVLNNHGLAGILKPGDLRSEPQKPVFIGGRKKVLDLDIQVK